MQLLKLVYIAHGWHLAALGKELFAEPVQAWKYGPVVPSLFHEFKAFGAGPINRLASAADGNGWELLKSIDEPDLVVNRPFLPAGDTDALKLVDWVWKTYGSKHGWELSRMTHEPGTPCSNAVAEMKKVSGDGWKSDYPIDNESIRKHYLELWNTRYGGRPPEQR